MMDNELIITVVFPGAGLLASVIIYGIRVIHDPGAQSQGVVRYIIENKRGRGKKDAPALPF